MTDVVGALAQLNQLLAQPNIDGIDASLFDGSHEPAEIAEALGLEPTEGEGTVLGTIPDGMMAALVAFIHDNLMAKDTNRTPITIAYAPASEWEMTFHYPGPCGHTVLLRSRYPDGFNPI